MRPTLAGSALLASLAACGEAQQDVITEHPTLPVTLHIEATRPHHGFLALGVFSREGLVHAGQLDGQSRTLALPVETPLEIRVRRTECTPDGCSLADTSRRVVFGHAERETTITLPPGHAVPALAVEGTALAAPGAAASAWLVRVVDPYTKARITQPNRGFLALTDASGRFALTHVGSREGSPQLITVEFVSPDGASTTTKRFWVRPEQRQLGAVSLDDEGSRTFRALPSPPPQRPRR